MTSKSNDLGPATEGRKGRGDRRQAGRAASASRSILNGRRAITGDTALRLAHFFGTSAEFWLNLQSLYELRLAQQKAGKSIKDLPILKRSRSSKNVSFAFTSKSISRVAPVRKRQVA